MTCGMPPSSARYGWRRGVPGPDLRVSDAERAEVAEILSKHFSDGRLDQAEFDERLQRAMSAKTRADLAGLLTDLPATAPSAGPSDHRRRGRTGLLLLAVLLAMVALTVPVWPLHFPWLLLAIVAFVAWRVTRHGRWHHRTQGWN